MQIIKHLLLRNQLRAINKLKQASKKTADGKVGFVSGKIMSNGLILAFRNLRMIARYTGNVRKKVDFPVFSASDFLLDEALHSLYFGKKADQKYWKDIIESGYITDIFMTPGWEKSRGAVNEYKIAIDRKLKIHYIR